MHFFVLIHPGVTLLSLFLNIEIHLNEVTKNSSCGKQGNMLICIFAIELDGFILHSHICSNGSTLGDIDFHFSFIYHHNFIDSHQCYYFVRVS